LSRRPSALFCDIDGTLSPLAETPDRAAVLPPCRAALRHLRPCVDLLCFLTGRPADDAWRMVGLDDALYVGNHGAEVWLDGQLMRPAGSERFHGRLGRASAEMRTALARAPGLIFEDKGIGFAIHYRRDPSVAATVLEVARRVATKRGLDVLVRSAHVEIRAPVRGDKGTALRRLADRRGLRGIVVIGDDPVDAPAFTAAHDHADRTGATALTVTVGRPRPPGDIEVADPGALAELLLAAARSLRS
jgi:trehalose 6-phosphate phosphatase